MRRKAREDLRSHRWFGVNDLRAFAHRSRNKQLGFAMEDFMGKPVIGIINTWSELVPCHAHLRTRADEVRRGVWQAGGFPLELPVTAPTESYQKPTSMLYRNMLAMEVEEIIRSNPIDGVVLLGGCDKTVPGLMMGAISAGVPALFLPAGAMVRGNWRGQPLGPGSDAWNYWAELRAGRITQEEWSQIEDGIARSPGTCMTMGTASTMAAAVEVLGFILIGGSSIPAVDSAHARLASASGRHIVEMVWNDAIPSEFLTEAAFRNAVTTIMAIGGSTNAIVHLIAMARRAGIPLDLETFDNISSRTPFLANIRPSGHHLMDDFFYAGGLPALLNEIGDLLDLSTLMAGGKTLGKAISGATIYNDDVIRPRSRPLNKEGGIVVLKGNICPDGAIIKQTAMEPHLLRHKGPAVVFENNDDLNARIDDPDLNVTEDSVLVLKNAGPQGGPGMPEWGQLPIPKKLLEKGVRDMVRISDARMSGTSYGACVLHVAPESFIGGPLALVRDGDIVTLDVPGRRLDIDVSAAEMEERRHAWTQPAPRFTRGFGLIHARHTGQADKGCDYDFLMHDQPTPI
jgi:dihydroxy-acid dehydratase